MSSKIMLYSGPGADPFYTRALEVQLEELSDDRVHTVSRFDSFGSLGDCREVKAIAVPGGNAISTYSDGSLSVRAGEVVSRIDQHRVSYYGVCAGAIVASSGFHSKVSDTIANSENGFFEKGISYFTGLFPGKVVAPLFENPLGSKIGIKDFKLLRVKYVDSSGGREVGVTHMLGPAFLRVGGVEESSVYLDPPPLTLGEITPPFRYVPKKKLFCGDLLESVYHIRPSGAKVLLTGSHLEIDSKAVASEDFKEMFNLKREEQQVLVTHVKVDDISRKSLLKGNFEKLGISCK